MLHSSLSYCVCFSFKVKIIQLTLKLSFNLKALCVDSWRILHFESMQVLESRLNYYKINSYEVYQWIMHLKSRLKLEAVFSANESKSLITWWYELSGFFVSLFDLDFLGRACEGNTKARETVTRWSTYGRMMKTKRRSVTFRKASRLCYALWHLPNVLDKLIIWKAVGFKKAQPLYSCINDTISRSFQTRHSDLYCYCYMCWSPIEIKPGECSYIQ